MAASLVAVAEHIMLLTGLSSTEETRSNYIDKINFKTNCKGSLKSPSADLHTIHLRCEEKQTKQEYKVKHMKSISSDQPPNQDSPGDSGSDQQLCSFTVKTNSN